MSRMRSFVSFALAAMLLGGCVSLDKYNALKLERDQYQERLSQAEKEAGVQRQLAKDLKAQLDALLAAGGENQSLAQTLTRQNADLMAKLDDLNKKYLAALGRNPLPVDVTNALEALAAEFPDVFDFDATRGLLKFKSDVTFASGSAEVTPRAKEVLARVATILNSASVAQYDLLVAGHTDSVRVINPVTIRAGHKDNWYLSAHRAITVGEQLRNGGTAASRVGVVGYADQHPVASNGTEAGKAQNRRVEILVLPTQGGAATPAKAAAKAAPKAAPAIIKDEAAIPEVTEPASK
jgi:chemotaxis protein MotB